MKGHSRPGDTFRIYKMIKKKRNPNFHYKAKPIRMSDKIWEKLKDKRRRSGLSWNLFMADLAKD